MYPHFSYLGIEEIRVALEFIAESLIWGVKELGLITDSLKERIINFILNVIVMEASFLLFVIFKECLDFILQFVFLLVEVLNDSIVLLLFLVVDSF